MVFEKINIVSYVLNGENDQLPSGYNGVRIENFSKSKEYTLPDPLKHDYFFVVNNSARFCSVEFEKKFVSFVPGSGSTSVFFSNNKTWKEVYTTNKILTNFSKNLLTKFREIRCHPYVTENETSICYCIYLMFFFLLFLFVIKKMMMIKKN